MPKFAGLEMIREESGAREPVTEVSPKQARPPGKRKDPAYQQISAYVKRDLYDKVRRELVGKNEDFSDLLEQWMAKWVEGH